MQFCTLFNNLNIFLKNNVYCILLLLTKKAVLYALAELRLVCHVILNGRECCRASEGEHYDAESEEEVLEPVNTPTENAEWSDIVHHLDEV